MTPIKTRRPLTLAPIIIAALALSGCDVVQREWERIQNWRKEQGGDKPLPPQPTPAPAPAPGPGETGPAAPGPAGPGPAAPGPAEPGPGDAQPAPPTPAPGEPAPGQPAPQPDQPQSGQLPVSQPDAPPDAPPPGPAGPGAPAPAGPGGPAPTPAPAPVAIPVEPVRPARPGEFLYYAPGDLKPGSGTGVIDETVYAPGIRFPVATTAFINSQVFGAGGMSGPPGGQCDGPNFSYPWRENFCEQRAGRTRATLNCPSKAVHQGVDIRGGTSSICRAMARALKVDRTQVTQVEVIAVEDGVISNVGTYTVELRAGGRIYRYLHLNMAKLAVTQGQAVKAGDRVGYLSSDFGDAATTFHLHFEIKANIAGVGWTWVSPYMSLVQAYGRDRTLAAVRVADATPAAPVVAAVPDASGGQAAAP